MNNRLQNRERGTQLLVFTPKLLSEPALARFLLGFLDADKIAAILCSQQNKY